MNLLLTIFSILAVIIFANAQILKYLRFKYATNLKVVYNKMEMHLIRTSTPLKGDFIQFLKTFKTLSVNPELLDIQVLALSKIASQRSGNLQSDTKWFSATRKALGDDFEQLFKEFDYNANKVIMLSFYKPGFVVFLFRVLAISGFKSRVISLKRYMKELTFIKNNDEAIFYSASKLAF